MNEHRDASTLSALKERLAGLSPSEIAGEMEAYLDGVTEEDYDPAVMDAYLDALDQRAPMPCTFDPDRSYAEFQARLRTFLPEEAAPPAPAPSAPKAQKGRRGRLPLRRVLVVAAAVTLLLGSMAVVQAGENSILGRVGAWTGDELWFPSGDTAANYEAFRQALVDHGLPEELAPGWVPERFMSDEPKVREDDSGLEISISLKTAGSDQRCFVTISRRSGPAGAEEEEGSYELYTGNGREFRLHIYSDRAFGVWTEGGLEVTIGGNISEKELKRIIDSMEPVRMEQEASANAALTESFRQALAEHGLPEELTPTWFPDGFQSGETEFLENVAQVTVQLSLTNKKDGRSCYVSVDQYYDPASIGKRIYEKDDTPVEEYTSNGRTFYILSNTNRFIGTWAEDNIVVIIGGQITRDELKAIIDSIEPPRQETSVNAALAESFRQALAEHGLPEELTPTRFPMGFLPEEPEIFENDMGIMAYLSATNENDGRYCYVRVGRYHDPASISGNIYEKDDTPVEEYTRNGRTFYILSNINRYIGTWSEDDIVVTIGGQLTRDELKSIIDSIEPPRQETSANAALTESFRQALAEHGLPEELTPTRFPVGFQSLNLKSWDDDMGVAVQLSMTNEKDGRLCSIYVDRYRDLNFIDHLHYEKDDTPVEEYTKNGRTFYILSNINTLTGVWSQDDIVMTIGGQLTRDELKSIIDSIGSTPV